MSTPLSLVGSRRPGPCNRHQKAAIFFQIPAPQFFAPVFSEIIFAAVSMQWFAVVRVDANNSALHIVAFLFRSIYSACGFRIACAVTSLRLSTINVYERA